MGNSLETLIAFGVPVRSVLDVGVQGGTKPLMSAFPNVPHFLFEPVDAYFETIRYAYKGFRHDLIHVALSDVDGDAWQVGISRDNSGRVTHSQISDRPVSVAEEPQLVECKAIRKARLDTALRGLSLPSPWLLKVDVDGHEIPILRGATETLKRASIVVVEAPLSTILGRAEVLINEGFELFDIVDLSYYYGTLSQVDLIFVRRDVIAASKDLRPWEIKPIIRLQSDGPSCEYKARKLS
jgi:FkbM family methyltransferase